ncbi:MULTISPECIES: tRNA (adenosine(37)-N6)-threonylcarbamoyltransferase complex dimerization subunit type 1 TsaB [Acinetobacter]|jgi:tRNA threonylcarbamoyladenosine biosynthesis protein TsaB|uniref:tRNA (adenosine(37)-N6)-threonylcarbamoyltransferase complex dimerization subunit type 1 TsaB n=1 Tax=Acinetobacter TaxID=469 RepID=UPI0002AEE10C|nr:MULTISPECIES: tRNA (adenosine(37)-N6)-threonylcarbamoyltransferase complex dimerization subunit type 1 TsaB [Acinetobacter]ELW85119.1 universal bacterial protein YeaZ [Acinetobacter sp. WC-743]MBJ8426502.1 tRNA (adenosine(37)-N6)-threonylcarbamoyltransferase complex dimerization subunit type 1 TsaB [Acinetobacter bereziniae]MBJ8475576.1 tRNA (adenosine(37)-N6)-threonylcarbamoyltransferase complex dimerization subunit type 1 TsaB [Acinetobacter bereziniae]MDM1783252.1 tRNA (adenosine(37)-N6)-
MKLLALETANEQCSVSIVDETQTLYFQLDTRAKAQTQTILPMIEQGFQQNQISNQALTAIAFSRGPGSFSGVRINAAVTQALAWAHDIPVIPVSTLQALAQAAYQHAQLVEVTAVLDARMNEVYMASFKLDQNNIMQLVDEEKLLDYQQAAAYQKYTLIGSGATLVDAEATKFQKLTANANDIATIARQYALKQQWLSAEQALPVYLRDNAWKKIPEQGKP